MATEVSYAQFYSGSVGDCVGGGADYRTLGSYATIDNVYLYINPYSLGVPVGSVITNIKINLQYRGTTTSNGGGILYSSNLYWRPVYINTTPDGTSISSSPTELGSKATVKESFGHSTSYSSSGDLSQNVSSITVATNTYVGARFYMVSKNAPEMRMWLNAVKITVTYTPHSHSYSSSVTTQATCTSAGVTTYTCSCGDSYKDTTKPVALGHSWGTPTYSWSSDGKSCTATRVCSRDSSHKETATATITSAVKTNATCTTKGTTTYTAKFSVSWATTQTKDVQDIPVKSHTWVDATCTTPKKCSVCGTTEGSALGHSYTSVVTPPTATSSGYTTHTCSCGHSYVDSYVHRITAKSNNDSYGTVTGGGDYADGKTATLTATPKAGYKFVKWNDGVISATRTVTVTSSVTYTAEFVLDRINLILVDKAQSLGVLVDKTEPDKIWADEIKVYG